MSEPAYPRPFARYVLLERIGAGGMSEVDLARRAEDDATERFVVIKRIRAGGADNVAVRMFQDEAKINAQLSHENIVPVYASGREGDEWFLEMEYVPGLDLRGLQQTLAAQGKLLPLRTALTILCKVLRALQYAHTRVDQLGRPMNIVHRDVNPRNVLVSAQGEVKLIDFGVAKAADRIERTEGNQLKGKFAYMAPEQIESGLPLDGRADLYAVGLMYYELLAGRSPWAGLSEVQILHRVLAGKLPPLPEGLPHPDPVLLEQIRARALATRPDDRFADADVFRAEVERALAAVGGVAAPSEIAAVLHEATGGKVREIGRRLQGYRESSMPSLSRPAPRLDAPVEPAAGPSPSAAAPAPDATGRAGFASPAAEPTLAQARPMPPPVHDGTVSGPVPASRMTLALGIGGLVALVCIAVAAVAVTMWALRTDPRPDAPQAVVAPAPAPVKQDAAAAPSDAGARPDPRPRTPVRTAAPSAGRTAAGAVEPSNAATPSPQTAAPETVSIATESTAVTPEAPEMPVAQPEPTQLGYVNLSSRPREGMQVYAGSRLLGTTPLRAVRVPVGRYTVTVRDPATGKDVATQEIDIQAKGVAGPYFVTVP